MRQRMELTGTNRSCGLTTYIFRDTELWRVRSPGESTLHPFHERGSSSRAGRKVEAVSNRAPIKATLVVVSL